MYKNKMTLIEYFKNRYRKNRARVKCDCGFEYDMAIEKFEKNINSCRQCKFPKIGMKYGQVTVIKEVDKLDTRTQIKKFEVKCDCGKVTIRRSLAILLGKCSCGCYRKNKNAEKAKKLIGFKIKQLNIIKFLRMGKYGAIYLVKCKCGKQVEMRLAGIRKNNSCGCLEGITAYGSQHWSSKINEQDVKSIRELRATKYYSIREIAKIFSITPSHVCHIISNRSWSRVK